MCGRCTAARRRAAWRAGRGGGVAARAQAARAACTRCQSVLPRPLSRSGKRAELRALGSGRGADVRA